MKINPQLRKGKASALSTDQIDVENADRYGIEFVDENNNKRHPIILHNSPSGAIERIIYVLLEKAAKDSKEGKKPQFPLWLAPTSNIRVDMDDRNESIGKRIREAEKEWIRYILVIGEKEANSENLSIRDRNTGDLRELSFDDFLKEIKAQTKGKPFTDLNLPKHLSKRPQLMV
jgi:threonyl-tRNA synthetase